MFEKRWHTVQAGMQARDIGLLVLSDPDSVYYFSGYWGYLGMEFGRPTLLGVPGAGEGVIVTPAMEAEMAREMSWIGEVREWEDGVGEEWRGHVRDLVGRAGSVRVGVELAKTPPAILAFLQGLLNADRLVDVSDMLAADRMVKTDEEIAVMRQAGQVAVAMCEGGRRAIGEGVPEYEVALAVIAAGTRKAAEFLHEEGPDRLFSPTVHNLQILQSGPDLSMVHRRSTVRRIQRGDPVYLCFCGMVDFKHFKLGFDREYFVGSVSDEQAKLYEIALEGQQVVLNLIRPGVVAEEVHAAAVDFYRQAGFGVCYRSGRGVGWSFLEKPELKAGDQTVLQAGMTLAVDGAVSVPGRFAARVGDSIVVTEDGFEYLTPYPKELCIL